MADNVEALVSLAQMGILEIHTWNATDDDVERPNRIVFDIDPGPQVNWKQVVTAAKLVRDVLKTLGLASWAKTTGGRGLHVVVPIKPERDWSECLSFARDVSEAIARTDPELYTTTFAKAGRADKLLIDYLRNNRTNTSVCAFSTRAATRSAGVDAARMARSGGRAGTMDSADRSRKAGTDPDGPVGGL